MKAAISMPDDVFLAGEAMVEARRSASALTSPSGTFSNCVWAFPT
jgi:hypothetical protein